ncbi:MAG: hypothetical protein GXW91_05370 [Clostridiales bacterium]|nr:hypothetical protein [Clostridiales bacterium]
MESGNKLRIAAFGSVSRKYELSDSAKKMFGFLDDIIDLYEFYNENKYADKFIKFFGFRANA